MLSLKRRLYQFILRLHPASFRTRFAREMSLDFEDALATYGFPRLLLDAVRSLARQWITAPAFSAPQPQTPLASRPLLAGHYMMLEGDPLTPLEIFRGAALFLFLFFTLVSALNHGGSRTPTGHLPGLPADRSALAVKAEAGPFQPMTSEAHSGAFAYSSGIARPDSSARYALRAGHEAGEWGFLRGGPVSPLPEGWSDFFLRCAIISAIVWLTSVLVRRSRSIGARMAFVVLGLIAVIVAATFVPQHSPPLHAQGRSDIAAPSFEVATIRPWQPPAAQPPVRTSGPPKPVLAMMGLPDPRIGDRVRSTGPIRLFISSAYGMPIGSDSRIAGGPVWLNYEGYDIQAKIDDSLFAAMQKMPTAEQKHQVELMEQSLLANRFELKAHWETRTLPVYALQVAGGSSKLAPAKSDEPALMPVVFNGRDTSVTANGISMDQFIHSPLWRPITDHIVVDQTGLTGKYDFTLKWTSDTPIAEASDVTSSAPSLFTALHEQLGLHLVPAKAPVEILVIDHIERPSEN